MTTPNRSTRLAGFTLVELLVVITIIVIVSVATLPIVLPALTHREGSEAARAVQAALIGARDAANRANAPRGIRLLPDPILPGPVTLAYNRMVSIEPAPDYHEGLVSVFFVPNALDTVNGLKLRLDEAKWLDYPANTIPNPPTNWYWNIRQHDKIRFGDSGRLYTVAGPMLVFQDPSTGQILNPERFINVGPTNATSYGPTASTQYLYLLNGQDDNGNGYVDEECDGIDNDGDGIIDPGFNGVDDDGVNGVDDPQELFWNNITKTYSGGEFEQETYVGPQFVTGGNPAQLSYTIVRRPVATAGAQEVSLPGNFVIDATTWNAPSSRDPGTGALKGTLPQRSRLPIDPFTGTVDIMLSPSGQVVQNADGSNGSAPSNLPFYHFWIAERQGVSEPIWGFNATTFAPNPNPNYPNQTYLLPMPAGTPGYPPAGTSVPLLRGERRLLTLFTKTGLITTNSLENSLDVSTSAFNVNNVDVPYINAQAGVREP